MTFEPQNIFNGDFQETIQLIDVVQENLRQRDHEYEVLMTQFTSLNMEILDWKQENQGLKEQKQEFLEKLVIRDNADKEFESKSVVSLRVYYFIKTILPFIFLFIF